MQGGVEVTCRRDSDKCHERGWN